MREIARPEVKRRRRFKRAVVAPAAAVPEPNVADKYYAQKKTCRMVELGIKVPGCKGTFTPKKGNQVTCSPACRDKLHSYHNVKSGKKNRPKNRATINARARARYARGKGTPPGRPCQGPLYPVTVDGPRREKPYYSWKPEKKFCSKRCRMNHRNEVRRKPRPTLQCQTCGKAIPKWRNGKVFRATRFCSRKCSDKAKFGKYWAANREQINAKTREVRRAKKRLETALA
jgi:endogenous inhibitor of DNA gyrase (YacG/DUF329 family)